MVFVEEDRTGCPVTTGRAIALSELRDFLIDRDEVTNRECEAFVRAGGYRRPELWKHPCHDNGRHSRSSGHRRFRDATGLHFRATGAAARRPRDARIIGHDVTW